MVWPAGARKPLAGDNERRVRGALREADARARSQVWRVRSRVGATNRERAAATSPHCQPSGSRADPRCCPIRSTARLAPSTAWMHSIKATLGARMRTMLATCDCLSRAGAAAPHASFLGIQCVARREQALATRCCHARWLMFDRADRLMGIIVGGRIRACLDVDRDGKSQRFGRGAAGALALWGAR